MKKILFVILSTSFILDVFPQSYENRFENRKKEGRYNITQVSLLMGNLKLSERNYYDSQKKNACIAVGFNDHRPQI
jgi:hypothetical protein